MKAVPIDTPPLRTDVAPAIRECFCDTCGRVAPSWFHSDYVLHGGGFTCKWCAFPEIVGEPPPK